MPKLLHAKDAPHDRYAARESSDIRSCNIPQHLQIFNHACRCLALARELQAALSLSQGRRKEAGIETVGLSLSV